MFPGGTGTGPGGTSGAPGWMGIPFTTGLPTVQNFPPPRPPFSYPALEGVWYVDSSGANQYPYNTWAWAANALATIAAIDGNTASGVPGDTVYCASTGSETTAGAVSWSWAGTATSPTRIISADKTSGEPPTTIAAGYTVTTTGNNNITINQASAYLYVCGVTFVCGSGASGLSSVTCGTNGLFESCNFQCATTSASGNSGINMSGSNWLNCNIKFGAAAQTFGMGGGAAGPIVWNGGSLLSGGTSPTNLLTSNFATPSPGVIENVDFSNADSSINITNAISATAFSFRNSKLPTSWSGNLGNNSTRTILTLSNCDSAGTNYILHRQTQFGDVYSETTVVRTGGASDGTTPLSWKMVSLAASGTFPIAALQTGEFVIWNDTTGSSKTITVEVLYDSLTNLQNDEIWLEVNYCGASGSPLGTLASSAMASVLSTPADITASTATWTTTGITNPNTGKLQVTFTPQLKGAFIATVKLCKPSYTVYVDPLMTVA